MRAEDILGQPLSRLNPPGQESEQGEAFEAVRLDAAGRAVRVRIRRTVVRDADGAAVAVAEVHQPATDAAVASLPESNTHSDPYHGAFHFAPVPMAISTLENGRFVEVNREYCRLTGYSHEELLGRPCSDFGLAAPEVKTAIQSMVGQSGRVWELECMFRTKDGRTIPCVYYGERIQAGAVDLLVSIVLDTTERHQAQQERENTVELVRMMNAPGTLEALLGNVSTFLREWSGWEEVEILPGEPAEAESGYASLARFPMYHGGNLQGVLRLRDRRVMPLPEPMRAVLGKVASSLGVAVDQRRLEESLRKSELHHRVLLEALPDVVVHSDPNGRLLYVSPAARQFLEPSAAEMIGRTYRELGLSEENQELCRRVLGEVVETKSAREVEMSLELAPEPVCFDVRVLPELDATGAVTRVLSLFRDITARKKAEAERVRMQEELAVAHRLEALGRLAGGVAHDFNNLLTVINGYSATALKQMPVSDPWRPAMGEILHAGERAAALVRQLLAFGRKQMLKYERVDLNRLITEMENSLLKLVGEHIRIETRLLAGACVMADYNQMAQVLINLVVNARDAMEDGGTVTIETRHARLPGNFGPRGGCADSVAMAVRDTGCGMDEHTLRHIFEPFFTTKELGKGTGLGLATVQGIIAQSGGHVVVESAPGKGTSICCYLPPVEAGAEERAPDPDQAQQGSGTILLVEDQVEVRRYTAVVLQGAGYRVLQAGGASEAVPLLEAQDVDLLITDLVMPGASGRVLARLAREMRPELPVLFISGNPGDQREDGEPARLPGPFLAKPFSPQALTGAVRRLLDQG